MRIISGKKKGIQLNSFKNRNIRPTTDRTRELIFNVLSGLIKGSLVLDIFAGTGSLGIEALSRGATKAVFVECDKIALQTLRKNLTKTDLIECAEVIALPAMHGLKKLSRLSLKFNVIFADPPYAGSLAVETMELIDRNDLLAPGGWFVIEHSGRNEPKYSSEKYILKIQKKLGDTQLSFYHYA